MLRVATTIDATAGITAIGLKRHLGRLKACLALRLGRAGRSQTVQRRGRPARPLLGVDNLVMAPISTATEMASDASELT